jgi:galactokinase
MAKQNTIITEIKKIFNEQFGTHDLIVRSPGRINLIGEHTDYNMGFVLPAAIDKAIYMAISKRNDQQVHLYAADLSESYETELKGLKKSGKQWPDYILGVVDELEKAGYHLEGFNAVVMGDVPLGAGLSSSAAVECVTAFALNTLFGLGIDKKSMVQFSQKAENDFVGMKCGIMDQFASMFGKKEQVIRLDCRSLEYAYMPFETTDISIVLFDTGVKHSLASSEYNLRREECEEGVRIIQQKYPAVKSLRDADSKMVEECLSQGNETVYKRCRFMVEEIQRVQDACNDLVKHDLISFGKKMYDTHDGLSKMYEVSCAEADGLVDLVRNNNAVLGARMMGGGFGGCTINIIRKGAEKELAEAVAAQYQEQFNRELKTYLVAIDDGTSVIE